MRPTINQPILFTGTSESPALCCNSDRYKARMFDNDAVYWQFEVEPCEGAVEVLDNPLFITAADWEFESGATWLGLSSVLFPVGGLVQQSGVSVTDNGWFEIRIRITLVSTSTASQSKIRISGSINEVQEFPAVTGVIVTQIQSLTNVLNLIVEHTAQSGTGSIILNSISLKEITYPTCNIRQPDGTLITTITDGFERGSYVNFEYVPDSEVTQFYIEVARTCGSDTVTFESETICVIPANDCDLLIGACGNMNFRGDSFFPVLRIQGELKKSVSYNFPNRYTYQNSIGAFNNGYTRRNKVHELKIELCPAHVRDFIYTLALANEIGIKEGQSDQGFYFLEEEPDEPQFPDREKELATITLRLVEKDLNEVSIFKGQCDASLPPLVIGRADIQEAIETETDTLIPA